MTYRLLTLLVIYLIAYFGNRYMKQAGYDWYKYYAVSICGIMTILALIW